MGDSTLQKFAKRLDTTNTDVLLLTLEELDSYVTDAEDEDVAGERISGLCQMIPRLMEIIATTGDEDILLRSLDMFIHITSGSWEQTEQAVEAGIIPLLIPVLSSDNDIVLDVTLAIFGNITDEGTQGRDLVLNSDILEPLESITEDSEDEHLLQLVVHLLYNFCRFDPFPDFEKIEPFISPLCRAASSDEEDIIVTSCRTLALIAEKGGKRHIEQFADASLFARLLDVVTGKRDVISTLTARTLANLTAGSPSQIQVNAHGVVPAVHALVDSKVVPHVIKLHGVAGPKTLCETLRVITNIIDRGSEDHVRYLVAQGGVAGLCQVLDRELLLEQESSRGACLQAMDRILRIGQEDATRSGTGNAHAQMVQKSSGKSRRMEPGNAFEEGRPLGAVEKLTALKGEAKDEETRSRIETLLKTYFP
ncbi:uncharacterized protein [Diadema antillarum]|uniref:uncharacterized protein n=1 Tax=Diadema antillarum TaxID=105358 RepID=UPI003A8C39F9